MNKLQKAALAALLTGDTARAANIAEWMSERLLTHVHAAYQNIVGNLEDGECPLLVTGAVMVLGNEGVEVMLVAQRGMTDEVVTAVYFEYDGLRVCEEIADAEAASFRAWHRSERSPSGVDHRIPLSDAEPGDTLSWVDHLGRPGLGIIIASERFEDDDGLSDRDIERMSSRPPSAISSAPPRASVA